MSFRRFILNGVYPEFAPFIAGSSPRSPTTHMSQQFAKQILVALLALLAAGAGSAWADGYSRNDPRDGDLPASVRRVQRETGGEVLKAQPIQRDGREVYRVKILTPQGRIRVVEDEPWRDGPPPPAYPRQGPPVQSYPRRGPPPPYMRQDPAQPYHPPRHHSG
jgi:hypothetical protein